MTTAIVPDAVAVTIGGTAYPLAQPLEVLDGVAPDVDRASILIPWGTRKIRGASDPAETLPALGALVVITAAGYTWRGLLTSRQRSAEGRRRFLRLGAHGPGLALDRAYLPTFARSSVSGVVQIPGGPRFAPGTRSAAADGPSATYYLGGTGTWTLGQALLAYLAHAPEAGLPAIALDADGVDLDRELPDTDTDGLSFWAAIAAILGHRTGVVWRVSIDGDGDWHLHLRGEDQTGVSVDLTEPDVVAYHIGDDASATLADLEVRGGRKTYVLSVDHYRATPDSSDLRRDWTSGDETARAAGDLASPAYRRYRLNLFALPDGSPSLTARLVPGLPVRVSGSSLVPGSLPWQIFAQLADSSWESLQGRVGIAIAGSQIILEGIDPAEYATWLRIRVTYCAQPRAHLTETRTGGAGLGRGLVLAGGEWIIAGSASIGLSGGIPADYSGTVRSQGDPLDELADELWHSLGAVQTLADWTRVGTADLGPFPGDLVDEYELPTPAGSDTVALPGLVVARSMSWNQGTPVISWRVEPRRYSEGAV